MREGPHTRVGGVEQAGTRRLKMTSAATFKFTPGKTRRTPFAAPIQVCWQIFKPAIYLRKVAGAVLKGHS